MTTTRQTLFALALCAPATMSPASTLFINELHYDNAGADKAEGVEIAGSAGLDLDGYALQFYNGSNGAMYNDVILSGTVADQDSGFGTVFFGIDGLQNGGPDGVALVDPAGVVLQFLSYEGAFTATDGAAAGLASQDIGLFEDGTGELNTSLQLVGTGLGYTDFEWAINAGSYGLVNAGQSFASPVPLPPALALFAIGVATLGALRRRGI